MKNWRTTAGGVLGGIGLMVAGLKMLLAGGRIDQGAGLVISGAALLWNGIHSADAKAVQKQIEEVAE